jgi:EpsD family peptidyl-prolyl cis-trans isomerase
MRWLPSAWRHGPGGYTPSRQKQLSITFTKWESAGSPGYSNLIGVIKMKNPGKLLILASALGLLLNACGEHKAPDATHSNAAANINGQAISVAEIDSKLGHAAGNQSHAISEDRMKSIVDMELLRQAAVQDKLETDENVRARLNNANRSILAMAYMEKQLAAIGKPTDAEITAYFNDNPARFAERKIYGINEFSIQPSPGKAKEIQAQLGKIKNTQEFDQWLTGNNIPHGNTPVNAPSDRLPDDVLLKLKNIAPGGVTFVGDDKQLNVIFLLSEQKQPVTLEQAKPTIANMLVEKRNKEKMDSMVKQLRDKAKIEYIAPYTAKGYSPPAEKQ